MSLDVKIIIAAWIITIFGYIWIAYISDCVEKIIETIKRRIFLK